MRKKLNSEKIDSDLKHLLKDLEAVGRLYEGGFIDGGTYNAIRKEIMSFIGEEIAPTIIKGRKKE